MSTLLSTLGRWSYRHPWRVLISWLLLLVLAGGGVALFAKGTDNSFSIPGTEAQAGLEQLSRTFPQASGTSAQYIVVAAPGDKVTDEPYKGDVIASVNELEKLHGVNAATSPYDEHVTGLVSDDKTAAIVRVQFQGQSTNISKETKAALQSQVDDLAKQLPQGSTVKLGGDLFATSVPGVSLIEAVGLLVALAVLVVTFRSFVIAGLPLATALLGVGLSMALIFIATAFASVSSTTPLLALMLGLAVGIDYALFIIARHQDQVRSGMDPEESASRATGTAGSAVVFAGITVLIALIGLSFANIPFLTTMGIAASVAVAIAVLVAVTLTPALLGFVKGRVVGWRRRPRAEGKRAKVKGPNRWVVLVTKHPVVTTISVVVGLGLLALPALSLALALPNAGQLPKESQARQSYDLVAEHFGPGFNGPLIVTGTIVTSNDPLTLMKDLGDDLGKLPGVKTIALATPNQTADTGIVQIIPDSAPDSVATANLVREIRAQHDHILKKYGVDIKVTGFTAVGIDISDRLGGALLPFAIFVVGLSLVLLAIIFRSVWVPITAALGYLLSVAAAFGIVSAVFIHGVGADALHVTRVGPIISFMPIILMGVLFGLAMDYQMFLVTRMREDYVHARRDAHGFSDRAMAVGAVRSGFSASARVVTAAAIIMFAVFAAFVPEGDSSLKPIALGLASGIAIDAFLVRMTLIPAVMALLGDNAWWMPRWLERVLPHFDIEGEAVVRERALAGWPEPDTQAAVVAEDLWLIEGGQTLYSDVALRVDPGQALVVTSPDQQTTEALLLTIAGRLSPTDGRIKVGGHLLPARASWVRGQVGVALLQRSRLPIEDLRHALRGDAPIVVIDHAEALCAPDVRPEAIAAMKDAASVHPRAVIVSAADAAAAQALLDDAGWTDAPVLAVAAASTDLPELDLSNSVEVTA
ncbi:efflux RND transporter permease subunit [Microbacterium sp. ASV49]|uniref:Efflux RND transporter permease subunit n=1 Tax=Microbacterium candidum TaxID=3041922 RepID=A0ABT7N4J9_9MICO|nr:efflux RND transporter permease subunit [Microbacterium sp. ASV49]MDL9981611.1 efflux RND transporter permease subunit [Microbacterium sp. ASV49]